MIDYSFEEMLPVVSWLMRKYTSGDTSSVTYERARYLMEAVFYCIQHCQQDENNSQIILRDEKMSARQAYDIGYENIIRKVYKAKMLYERILDDYQDYGLQCYEDTLLKGLPAFFIHYNPRFAPQENILTFDYPVGQDVTDAGKVSGIDAMLSYLECLREEQKILSGYDAGDIKSMLADKYPFYGELFINISDEINH